MFDNSFRVVVADEDSWVISMSWLEIVTCVASVGLSGCITNCFGDWKGASSAAGIHWSNTRSSDVESSSLDKYIGSVCIGYVCIGSVCKGSTLFIIDCVELSVIALVLKYLSALSFFCKILRFLGKSLQFFQTYYEQEV